jgi:hypothetical protein
VRFSDGTREDLEREVFGQEFGRYFKEGLRCEAELAEFDGPSALIEFLHGHPEDFRRTDAAICALLRAYQRGGPRRSAIGALLLLVLWPALVSIFDSRKRRCREFQDLWSEVQWAFLETAWRYPLDQRPARVASNLKLDTLKKVTAAERERSRHELVTASLLEAAREGRLDLAAPPPELEEAASEAASSAEAARETLQAFRHACDRAVAQGLISELDRLLIVSTRLYGQDLKAYARTRRLSYEMAKKRRQRAERIVFSLLRSRRGT